MTGIARGGRGMTGGSIAVQYIQRLILKDRVIPLEKIKTHHGTQAKLPHPEPILTLSTTRVFQPLVSTPRGRLALPFDSKGSILGAYLHTA